MKEDKDRFEQMLTKAMAEDDKPDQELLFKVRGAAQTNQTRKRRILRTPAVASAAVVLLLALTAAGFAYGNRVVRLLAGGYMIEGQRDGGTYVHFGGGFEQNVVTVKDGRIYFILDGSNRDITDECSESTYFRYDTVGQEGYRHVILVGGTPDNIGKAEYLFEDGEIRGGSVTYKADKEPAWLIRGEKALGID